MREKDLMQTIIDAARLLGWRVYHTFDSRRSTPGFPDLVLLKDRRCLVIETKTDTGKVTPAQIEWINAFRDAGIPAKVVRPADLDDVIRELAA
jgi:hypothetical protein